MITLTTIALVMCLIVWFKKGAVVTIVTAASLSLVLLLVVIPAINSGNTFTALISTCLSVLGIGLNNQYHHTSPTK